MKAVAAVLGPLASLVTIFSVIVRLKWAKAKHSRDPYVREVQTPSPGVRKAALIWLWVFTLFVAVIVVVLVLPAFLRWFV